MWGKESICPQIWKIDVLHTLCKTLEINHWIFGVPRDANDIDPFIFPFLFTKGFIV